MSSAAEFCLSGMPVQTDWQDSAALQAHCDAALQDFDKTGDLCRDVWIPLMITPEPAARRFIFSYLAKQFDQRGHKDRATGLRRKLWRIGERNLDLFHTLWPSFIASLPDVPTWQFLKEALFAAVGQNNMHFVLRVLNEAHERSLTAYAHHLPYVPFQDCLNVAAVRELLKPHQCVLPAPESPAGRPLRICYALAAEGSGKYSNIADIVFSLAEAHKKLPAEVTIFSSHLEDGVMKDKIVLQQVERSRAQGVPVLFQPLEPKPRFLNLARSLAAYHFDAVIFPTLTHHLFALPALRPGHLMVGLGLGDSDIYTSPLLDFTADICGFPITDAQCPTHRIPDFLPPGRFHAPANPLKKAAFGVPDNAPLIVSSGRAVKFYYESYWQTVTGILSKKPQAHFIVVGPTYEEMADWLRPHLPETLRPRVHFLGWRDDHLDVLAAADICLDTFPMAGGFNLTEAMNLGIPTVISRNRVEDYFGLYKNDLLMPIGDLLQSSDLCFDWDDVAGMENAVLRLIDDRDFYENTKPLMKQTASRRADIGKTAEALDGLVRDYLAKKQREAV